MSYQLPLSIDGLYDSSARLYGVPKQPSTRAECIAGRESRLSGEVECEHVLCRYHLLGELTRRPDDEADRAMEARLAGEWTGTCALDVAETSERGLDDETHARMIGVDVSRLVQISAEASARLRRMVKLDE